MQSYDFLSGGNKGNLRKAPLKNGGSAGTRTQGHLIKSLILTLPYSQLLTITVLYNQNFSSKKH